MPQANKEFLQLVRAGIWGQRAEVTITPEYWQYLMAMAERQSMVAVAFDGMEILVNNDRSKLPSVETLMVWLAKTELIATQNELTDIDVVTLVRLMNLNNVASRLMKGQGCASYYPKPKHRQSGDIDLFVGKDGYEHAKRILGKAGARIERETMKDAQLHFGNSHVELHRMEDYFFSARLNKAFQHICQQEEWCEPCVVKLADERVELFNPTFNAFYIFVHLYRHFLQSGVGLRQICDWMLLLHREEQKIDWMKLYGWLISVEALEAWKAFYGLTVEHLGLHLDACPDWMLVWKQEDVDFILHDVLKVGNLGKFGESMQKRDFRGGLGSNAKSLLHLLNRLWRVQRFGRSEVWAYPVWKVTHDTAGVFSRYLKK